MSSEIIKQIIARAVTESEFRELLLSDSAKALEGDELTEEERAALQGLTPQEFDALGGELEERVSRAQFHTTATAYVTYGCIGQTNAC